VPSAANEDPSATPTAAQAAMAETARTRADRDVVITVFPDPRY
jgi:hypothetical protein